MNLASLPKSLDDPERTINILCQFIREYTLSIGVDNVILGVSGGIDSALTLTLLNRVFSKNQIHAYFFPNKYTKSEDHLHIKELEDFCDLKIQTVSIDSLHNSFVETLTDSGLISSLTRENKGNLYSRIRSSLLYSIAFNKNGIVVGTSNKTELLLGYYTKFGDGAADIVPLADLYKAHVNQLAEFLNIPPEIRKKDPSAGLWEDQTDEKELGFTYQQADAYFWSREHFYNPEESQKETGIDKEICEMIEGRYLRSEHKRRGPIPLKIGRRTPLLDWRVPLI